MLRTKVDHESECQRQKHHAPSDDPKVLTGSLDHDAHDNAGDGEGNGQGQQPNTGKDWGGAKDSLEVKREEEDWRHRASTVGKHDSEGTDEGGGAKHVTRDDWIARKPFPDSESDECDDAEDDKADDKGRIPRVAANPQLETDEEHQGCADNQERSDPVNGFEALDKRRSGIVNLQENDRDMLYTTHK